MGISTNVDGANTTLTITYTAANAKVNDTLTRAAHYLWDHGKGDHGTDDSPIVWDDLTAQDKLDILGDQIKQELLDKAKTYHVNSNVNTTREEKIAEADTDHDLG